MNSDSFGENETKTQIRLRKIQEKVRYGSQLDPFSQLKSLLREFEKYGICPTTDQYYKESLQSMLNIETVEGQPRKMFKIKGMR